jgi:hypothetical protein
VVSGVVCVGGWVFSLCEWFFFFLKFFFFLSKKKKELPDKKSAKKGLITSFFAMIQRSLFEQFLGDLNLLDKNRDNSSYY